MFKNTHIWLPQYMKQSMNRLFRPIRAPKPVHVMFCFVDHFEPEWADADDGLQELRVTEWVEKYPPIAEKHKDGDGCYPKHSFFYPIEVYQEHHVSRLAELCRQGFGEVEVHLHHDRDSAIDMKRKLEEGKANLAKHGLLGKDRSGNIRYGFIHGNWALNNSRPDGRWCGVNNEGTVLKRTGCYADFTMPSAPSNTQTSKINGIYYESGDPLMPKAHDRGDDVCVRENGKWMVEKGEAEEGRLMIIQGPLCLNWKKAKFIFPRIENGDITGANPPSGIRVDLWIQQHIHVKGREDWICVKVHTHGAQEGNIAVLLHGSLDRMFEYLENKYNDGKNYKLHYVSAREMYNIIKAAEAGETGDPGEYRDYLIKENIK